MHNNAYASVEDRRVILGAMSECSWSSPGLTTTSASRSTSSGPTTVEGRVGQRKLLAGPAGFGVAVLKVRPRGPCPT